MTAPYFTHKQQWTEPQQPQQPRPASLCRNRDPNKLQGLPCPSKQSNQEFEDLLRAAMAVSDSITLQKLVSNRLFAPPRGFWGGDSIDLLL